MLTYPRILGAACAASLLLSGAAMAAPVAPLAPTLATPMADTTQVAMVMNGTRAGNMKQRHRTRMDRCHNTPSRC